MKRITKRITKRIYQLAMTGLIIGVFALGAYAQVPPEEQYYQRVLTLCTSVLADGLLVAPFDDPATRVVKVTDVLQGPTGPLVPERQHPELMMPKYVGCMGTLSFENGTTYRQYFGYFLNETGHTIIYHNPTSYLYGN